MKTILTPIRLFANTATTAVYGVFHRIIVYYIIIMSDSSSLLSFNHNIDTDNDDNNIIIVLKRKHCLPKTEITANKLLLVKALQASPVSIAGCMYNVYSCRRQ